MTLNRPSLPLVAVLGLCALASACAMPQQTSAAAQAPLETEEQKTLYALGLRLGENLKGFQLAPEELALVMRGLQAAANAAKPEVDAAAYREKVAELARARITAAAGGEKQRGAAFVETAAQETGAERMASGLVFKSISAGSGASPQASSRVKVHYEGKLVDGTVFDSSVQRGEPVEFALNQVIPCWTEGVQKIKVGGKARLVCPSAIAYGDQGRPPVIPGGATLVFEVELLEIVKQEAAK